MSLSDNLRRLARERIPTAPAKWLGPITPTVHTNDSTLTETPTRRQPLQIKRLPVQFWEKSGTVCRFDARRVGRPTARCGCAQSSIVPGSSHLKPELLGLSRAQGTLRFRRVYRTPHLTIPIVAGSFASFQGAFCSTRPFARCDKFPRGFDPRALRIGRTLHDNAR